VDINEEEKSAKVTVPDFQLSLAIGKEGQNARLAAKLTGWKIDIKSESQLRAAIEQQLLNFNGSYSTEKQDTPITPDQLFKTNVEEAAMIWWMIMLKTQLTMWWKIPWMMYN